MERSSGKIPADYTETTEDISSTRFPGIMESFWAGLRHGNISFDDWIDLNLSPQEWMQKYDKTIDEWRQWRRGFIRSRNPSWLQKALMPGGLRRLLNRNRYRRFR